MSTKNKEVRFAHIIPKRYLKRFKKPKLHEIDIQTLKTKRTNVQRMQVSPHYFFYQLIEDKFAGIEANLLDTLEKIEETKNEVKTKKALLDFISMMIIRNTYFFEHFKRNYEHFFNLQINKPREITPSLFLSYLTGNVLRSKNLLQMEYKNVRISTIKNKTKTPFIVSDKPILCFSHDEQVKSVSLERNIFMFPLTYEKYLLVYNPTYFRRAKMKGFNLKFKEIHQLNLLQWRQAHQYVYSASKAYIHDNKFKDEFNADFKITFLPIKQKKLTKGIEEISKEVIYLEECYPLDSCFLLKGK